MGCSACKEKRCDGGCKNLPPVLQINSEECPVLFHTVEVEGSSDDNPPEIGQYKNVLLVYKGNGAKYIFSSDGIPSAITGDIEFDSLMGRPRYDGVQMTSATDIPNVQETAQAAVDELANSLADVATSGDYDDLINKPVVDTTLNKTSNNAIANSAVATAIEEITSEIDRPVVYDLEMTSDANSVTFTEDKIDVVTGQTTQETDTIPTASATTAGTINAAEYLSIKDSQDRLDALENGSVAISGLSATPTQAQLTTAWLTATGRDSLINRASIYDIDNTKVWTYYSNISTWEEVTAGTISVNPFTNSVPGTILGSSTDGNVSANIDGTGTVAGWSTLSGTVSSHTTSIGNINTELDDVAYVDDTVGTTTNISYVATTNIQDEAVTTPKIADGAVTADKASFTNYSTSEQVVGKWVDGKPLYRRVFIGAYVPTTARLVTILASINNIETLVSASGSVTLNSGVVQPFAAGQALYDANKNLLASSTVAYSGSSINLVTINASTSSTSQYPYNIVVEYTKTTD